MGASRRRITRRTPAAGVRATGCTRSAASDDAIAYAVYAAPDLANAGSAAHRRRARLRAPLQRDAQHGGSRLTSSLHAHSRRRSDAIPCRRVRIRWVDAAAGFRRRRIRQPRDRLRSGRARGSGRLIAAGQAFDPHHAVEAFVSCGSKNICSGRRGGDDALQRRCRRPARRATRASCGSCRAIASSRARSAASLYTRSALLHMASPAHGAVPDPAAGVTRQTALPTSSATSSAPRLSTATPTGRPRALPSASRKPVSTSCDRAARACRRRTARRSPCSRWAACGSRSRAGRRTRRRDSGAGSSVPS